MDMIASNGMQVADAVLERTARHIVLLETLAESIETAADLDGPQEIRGILEHQSSGIRNCARQAEEELLPLVSRFRDLVKECEQIVGVAKAAIVVDRETGFLNANGFRQEHELRNLEATPSCLLFIDCSARLPAGPACPDTVFSEIAEALAKRIAEPFRPNDSIGRLAPNRFAIVFDGEIEQARGRLDQIKRSISGKYTSRSGKIILEAEVRLFESRDAQAFQETPGSAVQSLASVV
jgi:GGDEF domain-containing protein